MVRFIFYNNYFGYTGLLLEKVIQHQNLKSNWYFLFKDIFKSYFTPLFCMGKLNIISQFPVNYPTSQEQQLFPGLFLWLFSIRYSSHLFATSLHFFFHILFCSELYRLLNNKSELWGINYGGRITALDA